MHLAEILKDTDQLRIKSNQPEFTITDINLYLSDNNFNIKLLKAQQLVFQLDTTQLSLINKFIRPVCTFKY